MIYKLYNCRIRADLPIKDFFLIDTEKSSSHDIIVKKSQITFEKLKLNKNTKFDLFSTRNYSEVYKKGFGKFVLKNGKTLFYEHDKEVKLPNLIVYIFSNVFSYLLYQRKCIVLHGSAIEINGSSYFFSGRSGVGKSTVVNNLRNLGTFLSEDTCCFVENKIGFTIPKSLNFIKLDKKSNDNLYHYDTQADIRKRKIIQLEQQQDVGTNKFKTGFFLKYGVGKKIKRLTPAEALKGFIANMRSSYPHPYDVAEQTHDLKALTNIIKNSDFYNVYRDINEDFDLNEIKNLL